MEKLAEAASKHGKTNVSFVAYLLTGNVEACTELLIATKRLPEAAMFVRTYLPSKIDEIVTLKQDLSSVSETAAEALASPASNPVLFPDLDIGLQVEQMFLAQRDATKTTGIAGVEYLTAKDDLELNLIELIKARQGGGETKEPEPGDESEIKAEEAAVARGVAEAEAEQIIAQEAAAAEAARLADESAAAEGPNDDFGDDW